MELGRASGQARLGSCAFCVGSATLFLINTGWDRFFFPRCGKISAGPRPRLEDRRDALFHQTAKLRPEASEAARCFLTGSAVGSPSCKQMRRFLADVLASRSPVAVSLGRKQPPPTPLPPPPARRCLMQVPNSAFSAWRVEEICAAFFCFFWGSRQMTGRRIVFYWFLLKAPNCL